MGNAQSHDDLQHTLLEQYEKLSSKLTEFENQVTRVQEDVALLSARIVDLKATSATLKELMQSQSVAAHSDKIAVLMIACNRVEVARALDQLFKYRPSDSFPVILSQDCGDERTAHVIDTYEDRLIHLQVFLIYVQRG